MIRRSSGFEDRPPIGLEALPQVALPMMYGSTHKDSRYISRAGCLQESAAGGYAGLIASLFLAPLAWCSPRHRSMRWF
jgi:hypothetical protein